MKSILRKIFPRGSIGFKILKRIAILLHLTPSLPIHEIHYNDWTNRVEPLLWTPLKSLQFNPLVSIVVPLFNTPPAHFWPMIYSVIDQSYEHWELILVNASTTEAAKTLAAQAAELDTRIRVVTQENKGIAGNTNKGIETAEGSYIAFLDHDDTLAPQALYEVICLLQGHEKPQLIYSDEDKLTNSGEYRVDPHFKPDWSLHVLRELNYLNHFTVMEAALLRKVNGFRPGFDGAQDYDLYLRLIDATQRIEHIPKVLYHWRTAKTSTAENFGSKPNILRAGERALADHLNRNGVSGTVKALQDRPGFYQIDYQTDRSIPIAVLLLPSQLNGEYRKLAYLLAENLGKLGRPIELFVSPLTTPLRELPENVRLTTVQATSKKEFIKKALSLRDHEFYLLVNCAFYPIGKLWLDKLAGVLQQVGTVGMVQPLLVGGDKKMIVDAGEVVTDHGNLPLFRGLKVKKHTMFGDTDWVRQLDATSGRLVLVRRKILANAAAHVQETGRHLFDQAYFKELEDDGNTVLLWPFSRAIYGGESAAPVHKSHNFTPLLYPVKITYATEEVMALSRHYEKD